MHAPPQIAPLFNGSAVPTEERAELSLDIELRFHLATNLHRFVAGLLEPIDAGELSAIADSLEMQGFHLRITRDLVQAKQYLRERYRNNRDARYGIIASSRDRTLAGATAPPQGLALLEVLYGDGPRSDDPTDE